jgi:hypothetical protein
LCGLAVQFMQRGAAAQKVEEKAKVEVQEEVVVASSGGSGSSAQVARKWYGDCKLRFLFILAVVVFYLTSMVWEIWDSQNLYGEHENLCMVNVHFSFWVCL